MRVSRKERDKAEKEPSNSSGFRSLFSSLSEEDIQKINDIIEMDYEERERIIYLEYEARLRALESYCIQLKNKLDAKEREFLELSLENKSWERKYKRHEKDFQQLNRELNKYRNFMYENPEIKQKFEERYQINANIEGIYQESHVAESEGNRDIVISDTYNTAKRYSNFQSSLPINESDASTKRQNTIQVNQNRTFSQPPSVMPNPTNQTQQTHLNPTSTQFYLSETQGSHISPSIYNPRYRNQSHASADFQYSSNAQFQQNIQSQEERTEVHEDESDPNVNLKRSRVPPILILRENIKQKNPNEESKHFRR